MLPWGCTAQPAPFTKESHISSHCLIQKSGGSFHRASTLDRYRHRERWTSMWTSQPNTKVADTDCQKKAPAEPECRHGKARRRTTPGELDNRTSQSRIQVISHSNCFTSVLCPNRRLLLSCRDAVAGSGSGTSCVRVTGKKGRATAQRQITASSLAEG
jgi:hypothetical protein